MNKTIFKWAGNKTKLTPAINNLLEPYKDRRLVEPFTGSASLFLNSEFKSYLLTDSNETLIDFYNILVTEGMPFIEYCRDFFNHNTENSFKELRKVFNETENIRLKAGLFLYLNRHCFNGLCRYNAKGGFNTPYGYYPSPYFPETEMLFFVDKAHASKVEFRCADFMEILGECKEGDVVYCDPPYVALSSTASFVGYTKGGFSSEHQNVLAETLKSLAIHDNVPCLISNADTDVTQKLYFGGEFLSLDVARTVAAKGTSRKKAKEVMVLFTKEIVEKNKLTLGSDSKPSTLFKPPFSKL